MLKLCISILNIIVIGFLHSDSIMKIKIWYDSQALPTLLESKKMNHLLILASE